MAEKIAVVIAGDVRFYREGLAQVLAQTANIHVVDTAGSVPEVVSRAHEARPDVVLLDMAMPGSRGVAVEIADVAVVALSVSDSGTDVMECIRAGVSGLVPRDASLPDLLDAVERAACGQVTCPAGERRSPLPRERPVPDACRAGLASLLADRERTSDRCAH